MCVKTGLDSGLTWLAADAVSLHDQAMPPLVTDHRYTIQ